MEMENGSGSLDTRGEIEIQPRRIAGLNVGRILNFVIASGAVRPLLVVNPLDQSGSVNGVLFFDPETDSAESLGVPLLPNKYGHAPLFCLPVSSVPYDELGLLVGSWHWPARPATLAGSVDPAALSTQLEALLAPVLDGINEKLDAHLATVVELTKSPASYPPVGLGGQVPANSSIETYASYDSLGESTKAVADGVLAKGAVVHVDKETQVGSTEADSASDRSLLTQKSEDAPLGGEGIVGSGAVVGSANQAPDVSTKGADSAPQGESTGNAPQGS